MQKKAFFLLIFHLLMSGCAHSTGFVLYKKGEITPVILMEPATAKTCADDFNSLFKKLTGITLPLITTTPTDGRPVISLILDDEITGFNISLKDNSLLFKANTTDALHKAIRYFYTNYTSLNQFTADGSIPLQKAIHIPLALNYTSNQQLSYIEPYFGQNFAQDFRWWNNTNTLEETWGLWGHNIGKFIKVTPEMYAVIDGQPNEEQLNFSSEALYLALETAIKAKLDADPTVNKFMVMPYDNDLVCQCEQCVKAGNTKTNASPAVYHLIDRLATRFPKAVFFSTAYISTLNPPKEPTKANVGVMVSTMSFPKGVVIANSNKAQSIIKLLNSWKNVTSNLYLWDYAINFDNYFDFYPTVAIAQQNLQFYLKNGVSGIFMQGSDEGSFAAFGDLKCYLYAQLFNHPDADLKYHTRLFLENRYPTLGKSLADYYQHMEETALKSNKTMDIYGGIKNSVNKYLISDNFNKNLNKIITPNSFSAREQKASELIQMAFVFQKLELMRTDGINENGYAVFNTHAASASLNPLVPKLLQQLAKLSEATGIKTYNETGLSIDDYISGWKTRIVNTPYRNYFFKKPIKILTDLDEDYNDISLLNDGALGFKDYYNNWLLNTSPTFKIAIATTGLEKAKTIKMSFLYDKRHRIYLPEKVLVNIGNRQTEVLVGKPSGNEAEIITVKIPVKITSPNEPLSIEIKKQAPYLKKAIACDEIIFE